MLNLGGNILASLLWFILSCWRTIHVKIVNDITVIIRRNISQILIWVRYLLLFLLILIANFKDLKSTSLYIEASIEQFVGLRQNHTPLNSVPPLPYYIIITVQLIKLCLNSIGLEFSSSRLVYLSKRPQPDVYVLFYLNWSNTMRCSG